MQGKINREIEFNKIFRDERKKLIRFIKTNLNQYAYDPEDIIQDVAVNLVNLMDINRPVENFLAYVYQSVRNKIIDIHRKKKNRKAMIRVEQSPEEENLQKGLKFFFEDDDDDTELKQKILYQSLENLNEEDKEIIMVTEIENKSFNDLSEKFKIPIGTLLSRKHRAMVKLRNEFFRLYNMY